MSLNGTEGGVRAGEGARGMKGGASQAHQEAAHRTLPKTLIPAVPAWADFTCTHKNPFPKLFYGTQSRNTLLGDITKCHLEENETK